MKLGAENGNCRCAVFDNSAFCVESRLAGLDEVTLGADVVNCWVLMRDDVDSLGLTFDELTPGDGYDIFCEPAFKDVVFETDCRVATFDGVMLRSEGAKCCAVAAADAAVKDISCAAVFDDVTVGVGRRIPYIVAAVAASAAADVTAVCDDVLITPFTVVGGSRLYDAN